MGIRQLRPTNASSRFQSFPDFKEITEAEFAQSDFWTYGPPAGGGVVEFRQFKLMVKRYIGS